MIVDWFPVDGQGGKKEITVDPTRHCIHLSNMSLTGGERPNDGVVRLDLEKGKTYTVTASGEAFMTAATGVDADPFAGVVLFYGTDEEDGYAIRQTVLAPGKSVTFRSPWRIDPSAPVGLMAFFLDPAPGERKRGSYTLTITESGEHADSKPVAKGLRRLGKRVDDAASQSSLLILKDAGESDAAFARRALEAAGKRGDDLRDSASPAHRDNTEPNRP
jgi:hypothetical protein